MHINIAEKSVFSPAESAPMPNKTISENEGESIGMRQEALFERFSAKLRAKVGPDVYASWFGRLKIHSASKSVARFTVPTTFLKSWINNRYLDLMTALLQEDEPGILKVEILVRSAARASGRPSTIRPTITNWPLTKRRDSSRVVLKLNRLSFQWRTATTCSVLKAAMTVRSSQRSGLKAVSPARVKALCLRCSLRLPAIRLIDVDQAWPPSPLDPGQG